MASFDERLEVLTRQAIEQAREDTLQTLASGQLQSHADYKYHAGIIAGLRMATAFLEQALLDVQKG